MNTITYGHKVAGVGIEPIPPYMVAKEFDSTAKQQFDGTVNMQSMRAVLGFWIFLPESNWRPWDWQLRALTNWASFTSSRMSYCQNLIDD